MPPRKLWLSALLLAIVIASVSSFVAHSIRAAAQEKEAIAGFSRSIDLGTTRDDVDRKSRQACLDNTGWRYHPSLDGHPSSTAIVESPLTFGARNWVVYLVFENDVVAAVLVRTEDSRRQKPKGSPQDRVRDGHMSWLADFTPI